MPRRLQDGLGDHTTYNVHEGWDPNRLTAYRPGIRAPISRRQRSRSNAQRKTSDSRFVGIRRLRAGGVARIGVAPRAASNRYRSTM